MSQLKLEILLDMANKVSAPLKAVKSDTDKLADSLKKSAAELHKLEGDNKRVERFRDVSAKIKEQSAQLSGHQKELRNVNTLKEQADATAKRYLNTYTAEKNQLFAVRSEYQRQREQLKGLEHAYKNGLLTTDKYKEKHQELKSAVAAAREAVKIQKDEISTARKAYENTKNSVKELDSQIRLHTQGVAALEPQLERNRNAYNL